MAEVLDRLSTGLIAGFQGMNWGPIRGETSATKDDRTLAGA